MKEKFAEVCKHEGGEVTNMKDGSVACELGGNKIKLSGFADYVEIEREIFNDEPHVKLALYGLEDIIPNIEPEKRIRITTIRITYMA